MLSQIPKSRARSILPADPRRDVLSAARVERSTAERNDPTTDVTHHCQNGEVAYNGAMILSPRILLPALALMAATAPLHAQNAAPAAAQAPDPKTALYELRIYYPAPGKLDAVNARFRDHTMRIFKRHGMTNIAYWNEAPTADTPNGRLIYILAYPNRAARDASWLAFRADPEWQAASKASEVNGKLVEKVESIFMNRTDYSPAFAFPK